MSDEEKAIQAFIDAREKVKKIAKRQFAPGACPLNQSPHYHYETSEALWGTGCIWWNCEFCGEEFSE